MLIVIALVVDHHWGAGLAGRCTASSAIGVPAGDPGPGVFASGCFPGTDAGDAAFEEPAVGLPSAGPAFRTSRFSPPGAGDSDRGGTASWAMAGGTGWGGSTSLPRAGGICAATAPPNIMVSGPLRKTPQIKMRR